MSYARIAAAVDFYGKRGYVYMDDAPWVVGRDAYHATKAEGAVDISLSIPAGRIVDSHPVASGEQSFIQMMLDGQPLKRAICVTPCFRWEQKFDTTHLPYFMKAELINAHDVDEGHLVHMVHEAASFFEQYVPVRVVRTSFVGDKPSYDIVEKGTRYELGSYGIRRMLIAGRELSWIYGTGCAEPRLGTAIQKHSLVGGR